MSTPASQAMPGMIAYTLRSSGFSTNPPYLIVGTGSARSNLVPANPVDDSYWIVILDSMKPTGKVAEFVIPGSSNSAVPNGLDQYMSNPQYIFALATQYLSTLHVPQGALFSYLTKYGAGRELQKLEQVNSVLGCGSFGRMTYALTGPCGPRGQGPTPTTYEAGTFTGSSTAMIMMSLMPLPNGQPPYSLCNSYTF